MIKFLGQNVVIVLLSMLEYTKWEYWSLTVLPKMLSAFKQGSNNPGYQYYYANELNRIHPDLESLAHSRPCEKIMHFCTHNACMGTAVNFTKLFLT